VNRRGFTLVELLVASALTALMLGGAVAVFRQVQSASDGARRYARLSHTGRVVLDMVARDLSCITSYEANKDEIIVAVTAEADVDEEVEEPPRRDEVHFLCRRPPHVGATDFVEVSYFLHDDEETGRAQFIRRWQAPPDQDISMGGRYEVLTEQVVSFGLSYYDGAEWLDEWTEIAALPVAIRAVIVLADAGLRRTLRLSAVAKMPVELIGGDLLKQLAEEEEY